MTEVSVKTHLIITDIHNEFDVDWCGRFSDARPLMRNGKPVFALVSSDRRVELNTLDMCEIERIGKSITCPRGREAITKDRTRIYLKEIDGNEKLVGIITHRKVKSFAPMHDKVGWIG